MHKVITILLTPAAFAFAADAAPAGTFELRGVYSPSVVGPDCTHAGGTRTDGVGPAATAARPSAARWSALPVAGAPPFARSAAPAITAPGCTAFCTPATPAANSE